MHLKGVNLYLIFNNTFSLHGEGFSQQRGGGGGGESLSCHGCTLWCTSMTTHDCEYSVHTPTRAYDVTSTEIMDCTLLCQLGPDSLTSYVPQFHSTVPVSQAMYPNSIPQCQPHKLCTPIPFHSASLTSYVPQFHSSVPVSQAMHPNSIPQCQSRSWLMRLGLGTYPTLCRGPIRF